MTTTKKFDIWGRMCYINNVKQNKTTEIIRALCFVLEEKMATLKMTKEQYDSLLETLNGQGISVKKLKDLELFLIVSVNKI